MFFNRPQCECTTRRVQKTASVTGLVKTNGSTKPGMSAADSIFSIFHMVLWSPPELARDADVLRTRIPCRGGRSDDDGSSDVDEAAADDEGIDIGIATSPFFPCWFGAMADDDRIMAVCRHRACWRAATDTDNM